ncbi:MAG: hypothetical protein HIU83_10345 [Proteobacteria bacterium]|nr:hypothetical protein [Pseudomonadota bacterium]
MACLSIFLMLICVPITAFADCIITDTPYKFEVICSGYNPTYPPTASTKKKIKTAKRTNRAKKACFEDRKSVTQTVVMNAEELQFMQTRNRQDGYRGKQKPQEQTTKKTAVEANHDS